MLVVSTCNLTQIQTYRFVSCHRWYMKCWRCELIAKLYLKYFEKDLHLFLTAAIVCYILPTESSTVHFCSHRTHDVHDLRVCGSILKSYFPRNNDTTFPKRFICVILDDDKCMMYWNHQLVENPSINKIGNTLLPVCNNEHYLLHVKDCTHYISQRGALKMW